MSKKKLWIAGFAGVLLFGTLGYFWAGQKNLRETAQKISLPAELQVLFEDPWELNEGNAAELHFVDLDSPSDSVQRRAPRSEFKSGNRLPLLGLQLGHRYRLNGIFYLCRHTAKGVCIRVPKDAMVEVVEGESATLEIAVSPKAR